MASKLMDAVSTRFVRDRIPELKNVDFHLSECPMHPKSFYVDREMRREVRIGATFVVRGDQPPICTQNQEALATQRIWKLVYGDAFDALLDLEMAFQCRDRDEMGSLIAKLKGELGPPRE